MMKQQTQAQTTAPGAIQGQQPQTFTLLFKGGGVAVLHIYGLTDQDEACAFACDILPGCAYEVKDGDQSDGAAAVFYSWTCSQAQEQHPRPGRSQAREREEVRV